LNALKVFEAIGVTFGRLTALSTFVPPPVMVEPTGVTEKPLVVTAPAPVLVLVKERACALSLFVPLV
jgi:hypothetical protein